jgi:hypothetical protein
MVMMMLMMSDGHDDNDNGHDDNGKDKNADDDKV